MFCDHGIDGTDGIDGIDGIDKKMVLMVLYGLRIEMDMFCAAKRRKRHIS